MFSLSIISVTVVCLVARIARPVASDMASWALASQPKPQRVWIAGSSPSLDIKMLAEISHRRPTSQDFCNSFCAVLQFSLVFCGNPSSPPFRSAPTIWTFRHSFWPKEARKGISRAPFSYPLKAPPPRQASMFANQSYSANWLPPFQRKTRHHPNHTLKDPAILKILLS